jgi:lia operon protein LiaG
MRSNRTRSLTVLSAAIIVVPCAAPLRAQTERHVLSGDRVAIYNIVGKVRVESGSGSDVVVEVTLGGRDARKLRVEEGTVRGQDALRVIYPAERIVYPDLSRNDRTTINVRDDGTWGDHESRGSRRSEDYSDRERNRIEISGSGAGLEAYADLRVLVPRGQRVAIHHAVGDVGITMVDADLSVDVANANVTAERTRGHLSLDTGSGSVAVTDAQGTVNLDTGSGSVTISGIKGESLHMDTGSGYIN